MSKRILMVCLGNICRSPLAHGVLEHLIAEKGLGWTVDSAGTGDWHIGQCPDKRSIAIARQYGVDIGKQRARQFTAADFDQFDHVLVMDEANLKDVLNLAQTENQRQKVQLFLGDRIVPDPYYDDALFDPVYRMVDARCRVLIEELAD